jgi:hypothetical protein
MWMSLEEAADAYVAAHKDRWIDVDSINDEWGSVANYLNEKSESFDMFGRRFIKVDYQRAVDSAEKIFQRINILKDVVRDSHGNLYIYLESED